jgi:hypothetical protein
MSEKKHTPGPWFVSDEYTGIVVDSDGLRVAAAYKDKPYEIHDAHLIAAAPELLDALIKARSLLEESMQCYENQAFRDAQIDGAIRKAKGGVR